MSPLPPEASGISDYSAELLPELAPHYRIEVIVAQDEISDVWVRTNCPIHDVTWFRRHAHEFDRVLYHFGNSSFHSHMFALLHDHSGVVVLHDFFFSNIIQYLDVTGASPHGLLKSMMHSHGWRALAEYFQGDHEAADTVRTYPCNLQVLQDALGVIIHSDYSRQLVRKWYGDQADANWNLIPLMRRLAGKVDRAKARQLLGLPEDAFVVSSFGHITSRKLSHRLLSAWLASPLAQDKKCYLLFIGQNHDDSYGTELKYAIHKAGDYRRIKITGWVDSPVFCQWLAAVDVGVQLRTQSRGETSGAVLDCMNYGLATIVNANGSLAEIDQDAVWMLPDEFSDSQLSEALSILWSNKQHRISYGQRASQVIVQHHNPHRCAAMYVKAIEENYQQANVGISGLLSTIAAQKPTLSPSEWPSLAACIAKNVPPHPRQRQLLVDISELVQRDSKTGIQRVVRSVLNHWLHNAPSGWRVEPVYATMEKSGYRYACRFTSCFLGISADWPMDEIVEAHPGDIFLGLDLQLDIVPKQITILMEYHQRGINIQFLIYDLLPLLRPNFFPTGAKEVFQPWLETVLQFDGAICISRAVSEELEAWRQVFGPKRGRPFHIRWFHLGANYNNNKPSSGIPTSASLVLSALKARTGFLTVGTIEPRKGYSQTLSAFELLWAQGIDINLVMVGKQGWMVESFVERLCHHRELDKRLFWFDGISDEYLDKVYTASTCLIASSEAEGFGLPLIEAAQHKLPIIARDIPVFREVAGEYAFYFENSNNPHVIASAVRQWLALNSSGQTPQSVDMPWLTWSQSAQQLMEIVINETSPNL